MKNSNEIDIEKYLSSERYTTREELMIKTKLSDREIRRKISKLKEKRVVIYSSQTSGYRLAREIKSMTKEERDKERNLILHCLNEKKSRTKVLNKQKRKDIAYLKKLEQIELEELEQANYNHISRID